MRNRTSKIAGVAMMAIIVLLVLVGRYSYNTSFNHYTAKIEARMSQSKMTIKPPTTVKPRESDSPDSSYYKDVFAVRQAHLDKACKAEGRKSPVNLKTSTVTNRMRIEPVHNIVFCPVEKSASTFWSRTLMAMASDGMYTNPNEVQRRGSLPVYQLYAANRTKEELEALRNNEESLLVVRDPYARLFSAYVDKLFHPNHLFWKIAGEEIKVKIRKYHNPNSKLICGNDITFNEFIKYIIYADYNNIALNPHFTPTYEHCDPCVTHYKYISKVETLETDYLYIINQWQTQWWDFSLTFDDFDTDAALAIARSHIRISYSTMEKFGRLCNIRPYKFLYRTWQFLQISGVIAKNDSLPYEDSPEVRLVTQEDFTIVVENVIRQQRSWTEVKKQRREAMIQAYMAISNEDLLQLRDIVEPDCHYFNYDCTPRELFSKTSPKFDFSYFKDV